MSESRRFLVLGGAGRLARAFIDEFEAFGIDHVAPPRALVDVTNRASLERALEEHHPDVVINTAAWTDVAGAEENRDAARAVNTVGAGLVGEVFGGRVEEIVHFSTDFVFPGTGSEPWTEADRPDPASLPGVYGRTKLEGELLLREAAPQARIIRAGWLHGRGRDFISAVLGQALQGRDLTVVDDEWGTPTSYDALAAWTLDWLASVRPDEGERLVHHVGAGPWVNRFELARHALAHAVDRLSGRPEAARFARALSGMKAVSTPQGFRPKNTRLATLFADSLPPVRPWVEGVDKSVDKFLEENVDLWITWWV